MKTKFLFITLFLATLSRLFAQEELAVVKIPTDLLDNANAVLRYHRIQYHFEATDNITETVEMAITAMSRNDLRHLNTQIWYEPNISIKSLSGTLYDAEGKKIKKLKDNEFFDIAAFDGFSLYQDNRIKQTNIQYGVFPLTVVYKYTKVYKGIMGIPSWMPQMDYNIAVQQSSLELLFENNMNCRYLELNLPIPTTIVHESKRHFWEINNLKPFIKESFAPRPTSILPNVRISLNDFEYDNHKGNMSTWKDFGLWNYELIKGRDELSATTIVEVQNLVKGIKTESEKIQRIYTYMQQKTRYISIQLGIGGFQPMLASDVDKLGYGDCKALSNYMKALLKVVGIKGVYTVIGAGDLKIEYPNFSSADQMNHAILCVPQGKDTIWLECTSQRLPSDYISSFSANRYALLIDENGGHLVNTPRFTEKENVSKTLCNLKLKSDGKADVIIKESFSGFAFDENYMDQYLSEKEQCDEMLKNLNMGSCVIEKIKFKEIKKDRIPVLEKDIYVTVNAFGSITGNRMFVPTDINYNKGTHLEKPKKRQTPTYIEESLSDFNENIIEIPEGWNIEYLPEKITFKKDFGTFEQQVIQNENKIIITSSVMLLKGTYPSKAYEELYHFMEDINVVSNKKIILIKK